MSEPKPRTPYVETEMLLAAMEHDDTRLAALAADTTPSERRALSEAMDRLETALYDARATENEIR